jgi:hypothetical protein
MPIIRQKTEAIASASTVFQSIGPESLETASASPQAPGRANEGRIEWVVCWAIARAAKRFASTGLTGFLAIHSARDCSMKAAANRR